MPLTAIGLGVTLGATDLFVDALIYSGASSACMCRLSARRPAAAGGVRALRGPAAPDVRRPAAEYFGQEVFSDYRTAMPPSFPHKFTLGGSSPDEDDSEWTYPRGERLTAVASPLARIGAAAALSPPAALDATMPRAAAWRATHA